MATDAPDPIPIPKADEHYIINGILIRNRSALAIPTLAGDFYYFPKNVHLESILPGHGAIYLKNNECNFTVWAPEKQSVELITLTPEPSVHPLQQSEYGFWTIRVPGIHSGTRYKYRIDGKEEYPDPASFYQPEGVHGYSEVVDHSAFQWTDYHWYGLDLGDMIQYELHTGTFTEEGNFDGIIRRLPYLRELGINTIELLPIAQFPGNRNWGYDGVYPFAVQNTYGGPQALKELVNAAHSNGIAIILDVVYNHLGPEGNYFNAYGHYFTEKYKTPWGNAINYDDKWCDAVRGFMLQNVLYWLEVFHIDGLRLDAVHAIWDSGARHIIDVITDQVRELEKRTGCKKVLIAEFDLNNPRYINRKEKGGYALDGQWVDEFHHALHSVVTGETDGYYEDFGKMEHLVRAYTDCYVYTGQYSIHRKKHFGVKVDNPYHQFVVFSQNHDQTGNRMFGDRLSTLVNFGALKVIAAAVILSPSVPMLFMGEEYGEKKPFRYFVSHTDDALIEAVRKGRKEEFSYFKWKGEVPDPQSEETFNHSRLSWNIEENPESEALLAFYRYLIEVRKTHPALQNSSRTALTVEKSGNDKVMIIRRNNDADQLLILFNFSSERQEVVIPGIAEKLFDSSSSQWAGPGESVCTGSTPVDSSINQSTSISLNPDLFNQNISHQYLQLNEWSVAGFNLKQL